MSLSFHKIVIVGGGVLGTQIGLMCAYTGHDVTFWLRSEGSIGRTQPKIEQYSSMMLADLENAKQLIGNPMGSFLYPRGLIRSWDGITEDAIDKLSEQAKRTLQNMFIWNLILQKRSKMQTSLLKRWQKTRRQRLRCMKK